MQPRLWPTRKVWASGLPMCWSRVNCHAVVLGLSGLGMASEIACAPVLLIWVQKPVKPVAVRITFKAMYDINASIHVSPPSDGLRFLSKSLPVSVYYTMFVYVLLFVAL